MLGFFRTVYWRPNARHDTLVAPRIASRWRSPLSVSTSLDLSANIPSQKNGVAYSEASCATRHLCVSSDNATAIPSISEQCPEVPFKMQRQSSPDSLRSFFVCFPRERKTMRGCETGHACSCLCRELRWRLGRDRGSDVIGNPASNGTRGSRWGTGTGLTCERPGFCSAEASFTYETDTDLVTLKNPTFIRVAFFGLRHVSLQRKR